MRRLTIIRQKSFVACLSKTKIYVEDADSRDLVIKGVQCRYLGSVKNGETVSFEIGDSGAKLFAIAGKSSKEYCNELYVLPEGSEDITLSGKHQYDPSSGNAFRFDNNNSEMAAANKASNKRRGKVILVVAICIGLIIGFMIPNIIGMLNRDKPMDVEYSDLKITLTKEFEEEDVDGQTVYATSRIGVSFLEEKFVDLGVYANGTAKDYLELSQIANGVDSEIIENDGLVYCSYNDTVDGVKYRYYVFSFKEDDAFWLVQFWTRERHGDKYEADIFEYVGSVEFK